ncbi:MAG: hypothetical protein WC900_01435 [Oscillospiraceae bacterium]|jgi:hypothetical protein
MKEKYSVRIVSKSALLLIITAIAAFAVMLLVYSKAVAEAVVLSLEACFSVIIPSLFGFMAVSNIIIKSNIYIWLSKPFYLISKYILRIPPELFSVFLLSNIGGYPIGAKLISDLLQEDKILSKDAEGLMCSCYCSGPAFIIGAIGINVFSNVLIGFLIYISIVCSNLIIAAVMGLKRKIPDTKAKPQKVILNSKILIDSIQSTIKTLSMICGMLIFFAVITAILNSSGLISKMSEIVGLAGATQANSHTIIKSIIEISTVSGFEKFSYTSLPIITGLSAFGGICVLVQLSSISAGIIKMRLFYLTRPFHIILSGAVSYFLVKTFSKEITVMTLFRPVSLSKEKNIFPALLLIVMIILLIIKNNSRFLKKGVI